MRISPVTKLSPAEAVIAQLLRQSPSPLFGLELVRRSPEGKLKLKKGTVYVTLERMEKKELLTSELETSRPAHLKEGAFYIPRRLYRLTSKGKQALAVTLAAAAELHGFLEAPSK